MGWTYGVMGETQITASRAKQCPGCFEQIFLFLASFNLPQILVGNFIVMYMYMVSWIFVGCVHLVMIIFLFGFPEPFVGAPPIFGASHLILGGPGFFLEKKQKTLNSSKKSIIIKKKIQIYTLFVDFVGAISHFIKKICCACCVSRLIIL